MVASRIGGEIAPWWLRSRTALGDTRDHQQHEGEPAY